MDSDFISGNETVNDVSKMSDSLAQRDESLSTTVRTQFQTQGIDVHLISIRLEAGYEFDG